MNRLRQRAVVLLIVVIAMAAPVSSSTATPESCPRHQASVLFESSQGVGAAGTVAVIGSVHGITAVDVSDPSTPRRLGTLPFDAVVYDLASAGDHAYVTTGVVEQVDVSDPLQPRLQSSLRLSGQALQVVVSGDHAYVAAEQVWQDTEPFRRRAGAADLGWDFARVEVIEGSGILISDSVIDSQANDATTIPMFRSASR